MLCACIDIGSNTTRLLVAEPRGGRLADVMQQRAFTRLGRHVRGDGRIPPDKVAELAAVVGTQARMARELGATAIRAVATAALRDAANHAELVEAMEAASGLSIAVLSAEEEGRLAFVGATKTLGHPVSGDVAVVDVGGGSCEIAIGTVAEGPRWIASFAIGSGSLADAYLRSDPPAASELHALREHAGGCFEGVDAPPCEQAVAVGGSAASLRRLTGAVLDHESLGRAVRILGGNTIAEVARQFELDPERVRLLPAGILILDAVSERLGRPLQVGRGGLREGVVLELLGQAA